MQGVLQPEMQYLWFILLPGKIDMDTDIHMDIDTDTSYNFIWGTRKGIVSDSKGHNSV